MGIEYARARARAQAHNTDDKMRQHMHAIESVPLALDIHMEIKAMNCFFFSSFHRSVSVRTMCLIWTNRYVAISFECVCSSRVDGLSTIVSGFAIVCWCDVLMQQVDHDDDISI